MEYGAGRGAERGPGGSADTDYRVRTGYSFVSAENPLLMLRKHK
jgi:hypothetical protein